MSKKLKAFDLKDVKVTDEYCVNALEKEISYLTAFDADRLLAGFRDTAGIDMKGKKRYEGWEQMLIGGHTMGHYLTAMAQAYANPGVSKADKKTIMSMLTYIIDGLLECQANSKGKKGFIFGAQILDRKNVEIQFDNIEAMKGDIITQAWVPWYTMHKILSGIIDVYKFTGLESALVLAKGVGDWVCDRALKWSEKMQVTVRRTEFGGMNDCMYELYSLTGKDEYALAAHCFDAEDLYEKVLTKGENVLTNHHANTTIPKFIGALNRYVTCDKKVIKGKKVDAKKYLTYAEVFWETVVERHTYITGANSEWEHFGVDYVLDAERTNCNNETCNVYNMLKLSRTLFEITGKKKYADYYENAYYNSILASQNPETGMTTYFQPMATGYFKTYGRRWDNFWCCVGTGMENFTKLGDSIFFKKGKDIYVNLYQSAVLENKALGVKLTLKSSLPEKEKVNITINAVKGALPGKLCLRLPDWLAKGAKIKIDGDTVDYEISGGYAVLPAGLKDGTKVDITLPETVVAYGLKDNLAAVAFKYGPVVLSADLGTKKMETTTTGVNVTIPKDKVTDRDEIRLPGGVDIPDYKKNAASYFERADEDGKLRLKLKNTDLVFAPHYRRYKERYGIYFRLKR